MIMVLTISLTTLLKNGKKNCGKWCNVGFTDNGKWSWLTDGMPRINLFVSNFELRIAKSCIMKMSLRNATIKINQLASMVDAERCFK